MSKSITKLDEFNSAADKDATAMVNHWCAAPQWASQVCDGRPYDSLASLIERTTSLWAQASKADAMAAFSAHPVMSGALRQ